MTLYTLLIPDSSQPAGPNLIHITHTRDTRLDTIDVTSMDPMTCPLSHRPASLVHQELVALAVGPRKRAARGGGVGEGQLGARHHVARDAVAPAPHVRPQWARPSHGDHQQATLSHPFLVR